jgi:hypothetical protein
LTEEHLETHRTLLKRDGVNTKEFDRLRPDLINEKNEGPKWRETRDKALAGANWFGMDKNTLENIFGDKNPHREADTNAVLKGSSPSVVKKLADESSGETMERFTKAWMAKPEVLVIANKPRPDK